MSEIAFTKVKLPFGWLGNMSPFPIMHNNILWLSSEALFQALRFEDDTIREEIRSQKSPMTAKMVAKKHRSSQVVEPMSEKDLDNMRLCLKLKVEQHPQVKENLLKTNDAQIIEDVTNRGRRGSNLFWGAFNNNGEWEGENWLGRLWMELRSEIRQNNSRIS
jgi:ribA/ribD-fused uncharacterized protein